ncbi:hypothetical protein JKP88DRAFT_267350 [Tribonema minus]|uniref:HIG1 domain-containing protein n=1 Tax=Tribonema minus TaxID=303371 RepID=A0A835ZBE9_9STRA|nr:hypothetical protein JKP88DRAFT_267350 [Tribonema minus]
MHNIIKRLLTPQNAYVNTLPYSFKALLVSGPPVLWYLYSTVATSVKKGAQRVEPTPHDAPLFSQSADVSRQHHRNATSVKKGAQRVAPHDAPLFSQSADVSRQKDQMDLSLPQRTGMWVTDHPVEATVVAGAPIIGYAAWANYKLPNLTLTQRVLRTSAVAQVALLASLGGIIAFGSMYEKSLPPQAKATLRKHMTARTLGPRHGSRVEDVATHKD